MNKNLRLRVLPQVPPVNGKEIELRKTATHIQWRYINPPFEPSAWVDLVALAELVGPTGPAVKLRVSDGFIQYAVEGTSNWVNIIDTAELVGPAGPPGPVGITTRGAWRDDVVYEERDVVDYPLDGQPSLWVALQENTDSEPEEGSADWALLLKPNTVPDGDKGDVIVSDTGSKWELARDRKTVADLLADTVFSYSAGAGKTLVEPGQIITAQGFRYEVAASGASDHHLTTAGGVKLRVLDNEFAALGSTDEAALELAQEAGITNLSGLSAEADDLNNVPEFDPRPMFDGTILSIGGGGVRDIHLPSLPRLYRSSLSDDRKIVESEYWPHAGGYMYSGAMDGCVFRGHEYYFVQNGTRHQQAGNAGGLSCIVSYLRNEDGTFTTQKLITAGEDENVYLAGVGTSLDGQRILISVGVQEAISGTWKGGRVYVVQRSDTLGTLAVVGSPHSTGLNIDNMVPYGKPISVPASQNILLSMYGSTGGAKLYRSSGSHTSPGTFSELLTLFPATSTEGFAGTSNEVDLGYWGNLLVAVCRRQTGGTINNSTYRMTADLTGSTGWQSERELSGLPMIYPRIPQYTPARDPLIITATANDRARAIYGVMSSASHLWSVKQSEMIGGAGSPTLVRTSHGFGVMRYQDAGGPWGNLDSRTRVLHNYARMDNIVENLDLLDKTLTDLSFLAENTAMSGASIVGNCHQFNDFLNGSANPNGITMWIRPLRDLEVDAVYVPIDKVASGADLAPIANILSASDSVVSSGSAGAVVQGAAVKPIRLPVANVTLQAGVPYKIRLTYSSISGGARVRYNNVPLNRTPINGSAFEYLGIGTSTYSTGQLPCLGLEVR